MIILKTDFGAKKKQYLFPPFLFDMKKEISHEFL